MVRSLCTGRGKVRDFFKVRVKNSSSSNSWCTTGANSRLAGRDEQVIGALIALLGHHHELQGADPEAVPAGLLFLQVGDPRVHRVTRSRARAELTRDPRDEATSYSFDLDLDRPLILLRWREVAGSNDDETVMSRRGARVGGGGGGRGHGKESESAVCECLSRFLPQLSASAE